MPDQPYLNEQAVITAPLSVVVRNRERVFFNGRAKAVTSYNADGKFDILPEHVNFISIINTGITIYKPDNSTQDFKISTGVLKVSMNKVEIYLGILTRPSAIKK